MKTEELVEFVNNVKKDYKIGTEYLNKKGIKIDNYDKLFDLLVIAVVRCVKFEQMWEELKDNFPYLSSELEVKEFIEEFEKRYFLKEDIKK